MNSQRSAQNHALIDSHSAKDSSETLDQQPPVPRSQLLTELPELMLFQVPRQPADSGATAAFRYIEECPVAESCAQQEAKDIFQHRLTTAATPQSRLFALRRRRWCRDLSGFSRRAAAVCLFSSEVCRSHKSPVCSAGTAAPFSP